MPQQTMNQLLEQEVLRRTLEVQRYEGTLRQQALSELIRLDRMLVARLQQVGPQARLSSLLKQARELIEKHLTMAQQAVLRDVERFIVAEATMQAGAINVVVGSPIATAPTSAAFLSEVQKQALVMGAPAKQWWQRQAQTMFFKFSNIVRPGLVTGRTTSDLITEWRQVSAQQRRNAEAQVRTSLNSLQNATRMSLYSRNSDVIKGVQARVTLDMRTSEICMARSNIVWTLDDPDFPGPPPWHWNCRSTLIPVLKSFEELGVPTKKRIPPAKQASMNGQVPAEMNYEQFLGTLTESQQIDVLGRKKWEMWRNKRLSLRNLIDNSGRALTIEQLESRYS